MISKLLIFLMFAISAFGQNFSMTPQVRPAAVGGIAMGTPVSSVSCGQSIDCVTPTTGTGGIAGITLNASVNPGDMLNVAQHGEAMCMFSNQPVQNDLTVVGAGVCVDSPLAISAICTTQGVIGKVLQVIDSTHAYVNIIYPGAVGQLVCSSSMDAATMPAYIQAHQLTSVGPQGPTGATGATGSVGATGTAATITIGTVSAGSGSSSPTVVNTGTNSAAVLSFGLPKDECCKATATLMTSGTILGILGTNNCSTVTSVTLPGLTSGMAVSVYPLSNPLSSGNPGVLNTSAWYASPNTANVQVCNTSTLGSLTASGASYQIVGFNF